MGGHDLEKVDLVMQLLRDKRETIWVAEQLSDTFAEGVLVELKDIDQYDLMYAVPADITKRERAKRKKYGTTRPFTEQERLELLEHGLSRIFVEIPAIHESTFKKLKNINSSISEITFLPPDEGKEIETHTINHSDVIESRKNLNSRYNKFLDELKK